METSNKWWVTFLLRTLLIATLFVSIVVVCYSCSAINEVSNYNLDLADVVGVVYESKKQDVAVAFKSDTEAYLNSNKENETGTYLIEKKDNVLFINNNEFDKKFVFIPLSDKKIFWHNRNVILYRWEDDA